MELNVKQIEKIKAVRCFTSDTIAVGEGYLEKDFFIDKILKLIGNINIPDSRCSVV